MSRKASSLFVLLATLLFVHSGIYAQGKITSPKDQFGFDVGDDYVLVNYTQYETYLKKLDQESERLTFVPIGQSSEGRTMYAGIISSPDNIKKLGRFKEIAGRLSRAESLALLNLTEPFTGDDVKRAHREAMLRNHPDKGGSTYLMQLINLARDSLAASEG